MTLNDPDPDFMVAAFF